MKDRYANLLKAIDQTVDNSKKHKPYVIVEIGTYNGKRAIELINHAAKRGRTNVEYYGFDLFEDMTEELTKKEKSKRILPPSQKMVEKKIRAGTPGTTRVDLFKGNTKISLSEFVPTASIKADLIFIDGGHSLETIDNDFGACLHLANSKTIIILDDYYPDRDDFGCKHLIERAQIYKNRWTIRLLEPVDHYPESKTTVQFVELRPLTDTPWS